MYNVELSMQADLPTSKKLLRSTLLAAISAIAILVAVVLPAEYGLDPTGVGRILGLTEMGRIKMQLAAEAAADASPKAATEAAAVQAPAAPKTQTQASDAPVAAPAAVAAAKAAATQPAGNWRDEVSFVLAPTKGKEIKLVMKEGEKAQFEWVVTGGTVNYDIHADGGGRNISYEKGRNVPAHSSTIVAAFTGNHGWYWRNRGDADVKLVLRTRGQYSELKQAQ